MSLTVRVQLSVMMFLQFFIWGSWYVTMGTYLSAGLDFSGGAVGNAYSADAIAAIIAPFFIGMIADRFFSAQKVMAVMHIAGAAMLWWVSTITEPGAFFWVLLLYTLCYMPTLALVNAISFKQMQDPGTEFPPIRVLGTLGWIVAGVIISGVEWFGGESIEPTAIPFRMAAVASLILGFYSFFLPHTPPQSAGKKISARDVLGLDALSLMKSRSFAVFVIASLLLCIPLKFYYTWTNPFLNDLGMEGVAFKMSFGQISEFVFLLIMPFFFKRLGVKYMLLTGMIAWIARFILFAFGNVESQVWMLYTGIILHGICYDFFFVTGQIYVDKKATDDIRASAQGFIALVTYGLGMLIGAQIAGLVKDMTTVAEVTDWKTLWLVPGGMALLVAVAFALLFNDKVRDDVSDEPIGQPEELPR